ncbi:hypothetical protein GPECTOR_54g173 [Gonium pectorale]|uniref:NADP-dependent oxidoreductase domain-containing protein n=1 Tax=Gonium pectorale TaxID=33097 RepID=A0A150G6N2_GONPE|nr:hypothetical protein GPECTOR_54g173 [Gonium pectorale]|eukprot:KXZ45433.1 hypothetical protein GPECTOR_54g173 [Gonium pectorale]
MRTFCPITCAVSKCVLGGTLKVRHRGYATPEDTSAFAKRWASRAAKSQGHGESVREESLTRHFRKHILGGGLVLSSLGVGTYLGDMDARTDDKVAAAVIASVVAGWNVIDTASNYRWGRAESSIGSALDSLLAGAKASEFLQEGGISLDVVRAMLFISTKVGFTDEALVRQLVQAGTMTRREVVSGHSLSPAYINASLAVSLERLNLETVDLLYLHNPAEMQLKQLGRSGFMSKLKEAFKALESLRAAGLIRHYGIASWDCFRLPPSDPGHLSLQDVAALAKEVAGPDNGFTAIQLPVSAAMHEAWSQPWQAVGNGTGTLMAAADALGLAVFTSGPLGEGDLLKRLTSRLDAVVQLRAATTSAQKLLQLARSTPGRSMVAALVGHKTREFVVSNSQLARVEPLAEVDFRAAMESVKAVLERESGSQGGAV